MGTLVPSADPFYCNAQWMAIDVCKRVGREILRLRTTKGMTQDVLSGQAGISRKSLYKIENGLVDPSIRTLCALLRALGISVSDFFAKIE